MTMYGADSEALMSFADELSAGADRLDGISRYLRTTLHQATWSGRDAVSFRCDWDAVHRQLLVQVARALREASVEVRRNGREQMDASAAASSEAPDRSGWLLFPGEVPRMSSGRDALVDSLDGVNHVAQDEIEVRRLDNGRYIVILPGVVDLSENLGTLNVGDFLRGRQGNLTAQDLLRGRVADPFFEPNEWSSVRDMRYAIGSANGYGGAYASAVKAQLEALGVPPGADIMLVGHSYGAYTAVELATDSSFNGTEGRYNVTHVVAAGAETDWYLDDLPPGTKALVLNNRRDLVYQAEDLLHGNEDPARGSGHLEIVFNGGGQGAGHHPDNYTRWLEAATDRQDLQDWLNTLEPYTEGGGLARPKVLDPLAAD